LQSVNSLVEPRGQVGVKGHGVLVVRATGEDEVANQEPRVIDGGCHIVQIPKEKVYKRMIRGPVDVCHGKMEVGGGGLQEYRDRERRDITMNEREEAAAPSSQQAAAGANGWGVCRVYKAAALIPVFLSFLL